MPNTLKDFLAAHAELDSIIAEYSQAYAMGAQTFAPLDVASKQRLLSQLQEIEQLDTEAKAEIRAEASRQEDVLRQILRRADMTVRCVDSDEFQEHKRRKETALNEQQSLYALDAIDSMERTRADADAGMGANANANADAAAGDSENSKELPSAGLVIPKRKNKDAQASDEPSDADAAADASATDANVNSADETSDTDIAGKEEADVGYIPPSDPNAPKMVVSVKDKEHMQKLLQTLTRKVNEVEQLNAPGAIAGLPDMSRRERRSECYEAIVDAREELGKVVHATIHKILRDCNDELARVESETVAAIESFAKENELDTLDNSEEKTAYFQALTELLAKGLRSASDKSIGYSDAEDITARYTSSYTGEDTNDSPDPPTASELVLGYVANVCHVADDGTLANALKVFFGQDSYASDILVIPIALDPALSEHICLTYFEDMFPIARSLLLNYTVQMMHFLSACGRISIADIADRGANIPLMSTYADTVQEDYLNVLRSKQQLSHAIHLATARMNDNAQTLKEHDMKDITQYNEGKAVVERMHSELLVIPDISDVEGEELLLDLKDIAQHGARNGVYLIFGISTNYAADNATVLTESAKAIRTVQKCSARLFSDAIGSLTAGEEEQLRFIAPQAMDERKLEGIISRFARGDSPLAKREKESAERLQEAILTANRIRKELEEAAANQQPPEVERDEYDVFRETFDV